MRLTKELILQSASEIADQDGLSAVTLKAVASALKTSTPALYNHIHSLDYLLQEIAHHGMELMNQQMTQSAVGISGDAAILAVGDAYLDYMISHPGVYETIQWVCWHPSLQTSQLLSDYDSLLKRLVVSCGFSHKDTIPILRILKGFLHGYTTQQLGDAISLPSKTKEELNASLKVVLLGLHQSFPIDPKNCH